MLIVCPTCTTAYAIDRTSLGAAGRRVRCSRCKATWFARAETPSRAMAEAAQPLARDDFGPAPDAPHTRRRTDDHGEAMLSAAFIEAPPLAPTVGPIRFVDDGGLKDAGPEHPPERRASHWIAIVLLASAATVAVIGARADVVRYLPQTAALFAAIGLPVTAK
jgi:predicted Zn finger-like uncharacterized protein